MPTETAVLEGSAEPPSEKLNHGLRLALAPWAVFCAGMILSMPMAFVGAVFAALFTLGSKPLPPSYGWTLFRNSALIMVFAWGASAALLPYPAVYLIAVCLAVLSAYHLQLRTGDLLLSVFAVIAALLIPYLARNSTDLAGLIGFWLMANLLISMVASWCAFALFPEPVSEETDTGAQSPSPSYAPATRLARLALVATPFVVVAFVFDVITPFVLVFVAIQSTQSVADTSTQGGTSRTMLIANVLGGGAAVLVYEALVVVPLLPFAMLVTLSAMAWYSRGFIAGDARMVSATTAFLILLGGTLMPFADGAEAKMIARLGQLALAFAYLLVAFALVDKLLPEQRLD